MEIERLVNHYPDLQESLTDIQKAFHLLVMAFRQGNKLLICGNGGSAADSEHIVGELMKGYMLQRPVPKNLGQRLEGQSAEVGSYLADKLQGALPVLSLVSQVSLITAIANDTAADMIFAQQVYGYGRPGDVLLGLTTSGTSTNILYAMQVAQALEMRTLAFTGQGTQELAQLSDVMVRVLATNTAEIQQRHQAIYHALCADLEQEFFAQ